MPLFIPPLTPPISTGYVASGATVTKTLTGASPSLANTDGFLQQLALDLILRGVISA